MRRGRSVHTTRTLQVWCLALAAALSTSLAPVQAQPSDDAQPVLLQMGSSPRSKIQTAEPSDDPAASLSSNDQPNRPLAARRIVHLFDFEESEIHDHPTPRAWHRAQHFPAVRDRPGYPIWNRAVLDYTVASSGIGSVKLPTKGGSTALALDTGIIPVFPGADYRISARVRTKGLQFARAAIVAELLDARSAPIAGSRIRSALVATRGDWQDIAIDLWGLHPDAAYLSIELTLLQLIEFDPQALPRHETRPVDLDGAAWFDDVAILQIPQIEIATTQPLAVFTSPERPELRLMAHDFAGQPLVGRVSVYDLDGTLVATHETPLDAGGRTARWIPPIDRLGWYQAVLEVTHEGTRVGIDHCSFIWLAPRPSVPSTKPDAPRARPPTRDRFALIVLDMPPALDPLLAPMLDRLGLGSIDLPAWPPDHRAQDQRAYHDRLAQVISALRAQWVQLTLVMPTVPDRLAAPLSLNPDDLLTWITNDLPATAAIIDPLLGRFGQTIIRWHLGRVGDDAPFWNDNLDPETRAARRYIASLVSGPIITLPWRLDQRLADPPDPAGPALAASILIPASLADDSALQTLAARYVSPTEVAELTLVLDQLTTPDFTRRDIVSDLARSAVLAWKSVATPAAAPRLAIVEPWTWTDTHRPRLAPSPVLAAWRTLADTLNNRYVIAELPVGPFARCFVLAPVDGSGPGALIGWSDTAEPIVLETRLGDDPVTIIDLFGNRSTSPLVTSIDGAFRVHHIALPTTPIVVEGVDVQLAALQASLRFEPALIPASNTVQDRTLIITNPWPYELTGRLALVEPLPPEAQGSWTVHPRVRLIAIPPGESIKLPLTIALSPFEPTGPVPIVLSLTLDSRTANDPIALRTNARVGLDHLTLRLTQRAAPTAHGPDLLIETRVTNMGNQPMTIEITVFADGPFDRQMSVISDLVPGSSVTRRFAFTDGMDLLAGQSVFVSVLDVDRRERLNDSLTIAPRTAAPATAGVLSPR